MNSKGLISEKTGYRIILLLVVGLTAFSSAMKELNQIQELSLEANQLVAEWMPKNAPVPAEAQQLAVRVESCESKQSAPAVELPWVHSVADEERAERAESQATESVPVVIARRERSCKAEIAKSKKAQRVAMDPLKFEVRILNEHAADHEDADQQELPVMSDFQVPAFKFKNRKHETFRFNSRDREMILKTVNRSINVRVAG